MRKTNNFLSCEREAKEWLFIHGLLPRDEAEKILEEKENAKRKSLCSSAKRRRTRTPRKPPKRGSSAKKKKKVSQLY